MAAPKPDDLPDGNFGFTVQDSLSGPDGEKPIFPGDTDKGIRYYPDFFTA
jgi:hypothetical protein